MKSLQLFSWNLHEVGHCLSNFIQEIHIESFFLIDSHLMQVSVLLVYPIILINKMRTLS